MSWVFCHQATITLVTRLGGNRAIPSRSFASFRWDLESGEVELASHVQMSTADSGHRVALRGVAHALEARTGCVDQPISFQGWSVVGQKPYRSVLAACRIRRQPSRWRWGTSSGGQKCVLESGSTAQQHATLNQSRRPHAVSTAPRISLGAGPRGHSRTLDRSTRQLAAGTCR